MKTILWVITPAVILGLASGIGAGYFRFGATDKIYTFSKSPLTRQAAIPRRANVRPQLEVLDEPVYDFGVMSRNERRRRTFTVANRGNADLEIAFVDKSCQCTEVAISQRVVPPGEMTEITLTWQPSSFDPKFEQTARFRTNDPGRIELDLTVKGKVLQILHIEPRQLSFHQANPERTRTASCRLFAYRDEDLRIEETAWLHPETAPFFAVDVEPLSDDQLASETGAVAGYELAVTLKPGMPVGKFQQRLRIVTNYPDLGVREVPILGSIAGHVKMLGRDYADGLWNLGLLSGDQVHQRKLRILIKHPKPVEMNVATVDPSNVLDVELEPPQNRGGTWLATLTLKVNPVGSVITRLGNQQGELARIELETNLPDARRLEIPVAFGIESQLSSP